ncbi:MAG: hypothetical protein WCI57_01540 [Candidatus Berkelbacteria bacterium]
MKKKLIDRSRIDIAIRAAENIAQHYYLPVGHTFDYPLLTKKQLRLSEQMISYISSLKDNGFSPIISSNMSYESFLEYYMARINEGTVARFRNTLADKRTFDRMIAKLEVIGKYNSTRDNRVKMDRYVISEEIHFVKVEGRRNLVRRVDLYLR